MTTLLVSHRFPLAALDLLQIQQPLYLLLAVAAAAAAAEHGGQLADIQPATACQDACRQRAQNKQPRTG